MRVLAFLLLALATPSGPLTFTLRIDGQKELSATVSGAEAELPGGPFRGSISMNGSPTELPVAGTVVHAGGRWRLPLSVRYADVPADWAERFRPETFTSSCSIPANLRTHPPWKE